ncbi:alpha/beta-hydrolase [Penicillium chermesinum]|uniref:Alpha/beta-hydrolase n=1 Tax=Penicillium chermesinum TaxID=63820 RepID=A0A9W9PI05_9EURO|nr:alpha/beta-hydrolase [Penicillium chermesinum]KAJ5247188.1 alpha/beta-hydrolase [Penicillium chermesinum]KAJ6145432.1 alpha/beta-hydrolase [Penicillium chermesinum]
MSLLTYIRLRIGALLLRTFFRLKGRFISHPDAIEHIPSRDPNRTIKIHVYGPSWDLEKLDEPVPVLVNFHGSGFVIPAHGSDDAFCREVCDRTGYVVLDVQYRLSPEYPFPAAIHDVEDVVKWVLGQPDVFDLNRFSLSGFSAGGNLALVACSSLFPLNTFQSVLTFYPSTEPCGDPALMVAPERGGMPIPMVTLRFFGKCYLRYGADLRDPRISPSLADITRFPGKVLVITASYDNLANEAERLAKRLEKDPKRTVVYEQMPKCNHGWDKKAKRGTPQWVSKCRAYDLAVDMLLS